MTTTYEFRMAPDGLAHLAPRGLVRAVCGRDTRRRAPERAVPCGRCLDIAAEKIADAA